jgi:hypothetical protein
MCRCAYKKKKTLGSEFNYKAEQVSTVVRIANLIDAGAGEAVGDAGGRLDQSAERRANL